MPPKSDDAKQLAATLAALPATTNRWFLANVRAWRRRLLPRGPWQRYLEIGVYEAASLLWFATYLLGDGGTAIGIDPWDGECMGGARKHKARMARVKQLAWARIDAFNEYHPRRKVIPLQTSSVPFLSRAILEKQTFDCIYVDGQHTAPETLLDLGMAWRVLEMGGLLIVDDIHLHAARKPRCAPFPQTQEAWQAFLACYQGRYELVYQAKRSTAVRKLAQ